mgnify:CR=1 FL=1
MEVREYFKTLPDTDLNRRLLLRWSEQDERGRKLQQKLFSEEPDAATPDQGQIQVHVSSTTTLQIRAEDDSDVEDEIDPVVLNRLIVSRMTSGSARATRITSEDVFKQVVSNVCIKTEFRLAYDEKKNRCASVLAFAAHLKKAEEFKWPTTETGDELRAVLAGERPPKPHPEPR